MAEMDRQLEKFRRPILVIFIVLMLSCVGMLQTSLNQDRRDLGLTHLSEPLENAPPVLAFTTVALGGFRGLIANALWMRATDLQDEGKYFEMVQLADWITKLQPRITTVWYHLAWNMAYNISVKFRDPAERWLWVQRGIELLRDHGLQYNPDETLLYRELSWFFQHKMGQNLDDAHYFYKTAWVDEMKAVLGENHDSYRDLLKPETPEHFDRLQTLKGRYKMDVNIMAEVDEVHGPLDWRLPEAHAIYWAYRGWRDADEADKMTVRRSIYQSMQLAFQRGRLLENRFTKTYELGPNLEIISKVSASYEQMMEEDPGMAGHIDGAHRNFLKKAVYFLYLNARRTEADEWFAYLKEKYPASVPAGQTLDGYAVDQTQEDVGETSAVDTMAMIEGFLLQHYLYLAIAEDEKALGSHNMAQNIWNRYTYQTRKSTSRVRLADFGWIKGKVLNSIISPDFSANPEMVAQLKTVLGLGAVVTEIPLEGRGPAGEIEGPIPETEENISEEK